MDNLELCVILPVTNAQATLRSDCCDVLDVVAEVSQAFEVVIIDNGSVDDTYEVAVDLGTRFPQVRVLRLATRHPIERACSAALRLVNATTIVAHDGLGPIHAGQILAQCLKNAPLPQAADELAAVPAQDTPGAWLRRYLPWAEAHADLHEAHSRLSGFRLVRRRAASDLPAVSSRGAGDYELISS